MKKRTERWVSCLLCLAMLFSMATPLKAWAEEPDMPEEQVTAQEGSGDPSTEDPKENSAEDPEEAPQEDPEEAPQEAPEEGSEEAPEELLEEEPVLLSLRAVSDTYEIYPTPHSIVYGDAAVTLPETMQVIYESGIDVYTKARAEKAFDQVGVTLSESADTGVKLRVGVKGSGGAVDTYFAGHAPATAGLYNKDAAYQLIVNAEGVSVLGVNTDAAFYGLTTMKHILYQVALEDSKDVRLLTVEDYADVAFRGFIEGYYGNPWSVEDRAELMRFGGELKMNIYFYAPKDDPKHRAQWRVLYTDEELETLIKPLADAGNESKCYYGFALHPFASNVLRCDTDEHYQADMEILKAKYEQAISVGVRQIALLGDDAGLPPGSSDDANNSYVQILNDLTDWLASEEMQTKYPGLQTSVPFCPGPSTRYASADGNDALLKSLAPVGTGVGKLTGNVPIIMTGGAVWGHVSSTFVNRFNNNVGVGPFYWVNWPCSDNSKGSIVFGGHDITLERGVTPGSVKGIMLNPMQQSEPSKQGLFCNADYSWNMWQDEVRPDKAWTASFKYVDHMGADDNNTSVALRELAKHMMRMNGNGNTNYQESVDLAPTLTAFREAMAAGSLTTEQIDSLRAEFVTLKNAATLYKARGNQRLVGKQNADGSYPSAQEQMHPWLDTFEELAQADVDLLDALKLILTNAGGANDNAIVQKYLAGQTSLTASKNHKFWYVDHYETAVVGGQHLVAFSNDLMSTVAETAMTILDPSTLIETIITSRNDTPIGGLDAMRDGSTATEAVFKSPNSLAVGDYVGVRYNRPISLTSVRFEVGTADNANDTFNDSKLQYLDENDEWQDIPGATFAHADLVLEATGLNLSAKGVRAIATSARTNTWFGVKEIYINGKSGSQQEAEAAFGQLSGTVIKSSRWAVYESAHPESNLTDGDDSTFVWYKENDPDKDKSVVGDYLGLDLGRVVKNVGRVRLVVGNGSSGDKWTNFKLQYSADGSNWTDAGTYASPNRQDIIEEDLGGVEARYVRFVNTVQVNNWLYFSELSVWAYDAGAILYQSDAVKKVTNPSGELTDDKAKITADNVILRPNEFVGVALPRIRAIVDIVADYTPAPGVVLKAGMNEDELEIIDLSGRARAAMPEYARYVRLENVSTTTVSFKLNELTVHSEEIGGIAFLDSNIAIHSFNDYAAQDARNLETTGYWFDGDIDTVATYANVQQPGDHVTYDLGQTREITSVTAVMGNTPANGNFVRNAEIQISQDNENWITVTTITSADGANDPITAGWSLYNVANYSCCTGTLSNPQSARYLRLLITGESAYFPALAEIIINGGEYVRTVNDPTFETDPIEPSAEFTPDKMRDGNLTTGFQPNMTGKTSGHLIYRLSEDTSIGQINIIEGTSSGATVSIRPVGEPAFQNIGTMAGGLNQFVLDEDISGVAELKLTWGNVTPTVYEIITVSREEVQAAGGQAPSETETVPINSYSGSDCTILFDDNWKFNLGDASGAGAQVYNDSGWRTVDLPHDYSIEGEFTSAGEAESGYLLGGIGWYRKSFTVDPTWEGKVVTIDFGGVYMDTEVYLNGVKLGEHHYGYTPFSFVLSNLDYTGENVIAVKVNNPVPTSRWYSGSGIYRSVHLTVSESVHVAHYGTKVETTNAGAVTVKTNVENSGSAAANVTVKQEIFELDGVTFEKKGAAVATNTSSATSVASGGVQEVSQSLSVSDPKLWNSWDKGTPNLYVLKTTVLVDGVEKDTYETEFGFRTIEFTVNDGFKLNGVNVKLKGVCQHHDQGALGAEAWYRALERQVDILMDMGVNSIRVTHNPAADELIEICNRKGVLLIDEAFDGWSVAKNGNSGDFARWFNRTIADDNALVGKKSDETWAQFVWETMLNRDKNAPSVIMYSMCNEVQEGASFGSDFLTIADNLISWAQAIDTTRPLTRGDNSRTASNTGNQGLLNKKIHDAGGVVGFNYYGGNQNPIAGGHDLGWRMYASETASHVNSRGVYTSKSSSLNGDKLLTSYDKSAVSWGATASDAWWRTIQYDYSAGEYIWTGFDYIGEPSPANGTGSGWASGENSPKSSFFGAIDTNGLPKDNYWLYRSMWNENAHTLHILPTWDERDVLKDGSGNVEVVVYTDAPMIKLYLNGTEVGSATTTVQHSNTNLYTYRTFTSGTGCFVQKSGHESLYATFNVPYAAGTLKAVACEADGTPANWVTQGRSEVKSTSGASTLRVEADRATILNDGRDLSYITVSVTDAAGNIVNSARNEITVSVSGDGVFMGMDNGVQPDHTSYLSNTRAAGAGQVVAIVQSTKKAGSFDVTATAAGLTPAVVTVTTSGAVSAVQPTTPVSYGLSKTIYVQLNTEPNLPDTVEVTLGDGSTVGKSITWADYDKSLLATAGNEFSITGIIADYNIPVSIGVVVLDDIVALLNYSAAVKVGEVPILPAGRPAVMADGTVVSAQFAVTWAMPDVTTAFNRPGTVEITGTATAFGKEYPVTAFVRVAKEDISVGRNVAGDAATATAGSAANTAVNDGDASTAWTGSGAVTLGYDTALNLYQLKLTYADAVPATRPTIEVSADSNPENATWEAITVSRTVNGLTATYQLPTTKSVVLVRITYASQVSLAELELITGTSVFPIGSTAELDDLKVNGQSPTAAQLAAKSIRSSAVVATLTPVSDQNVACTILPEDSHSRIIIVTESEDHANRAKYTVQLDAPAPLPATDDTNDYPRANTTATAGSDNGNTVGSAVDGNTGTLWHSAYNNGSAEANASDKLTGFPEKRWFQLTLDQPTELVALRYLPRSSQTNGTVKDYRIEVSKDGTNWMTVAEGSWTSSVDWKIAMFDQSVEAKYVKLWGVNTYGDGAQANYFMAAAEVRVVMKPTEEKLDLSQAVITIADPDMEPDGSFHWRNVEIRPETVTVTLFGEELTEGVDYVLDYESNTDPGTAYIYARALASSDYQGAAATTFSIVKMPVVVQSFMPLTIQTQEGVDPTLPSTVWAEMSDGHHVQVEVEWDPVDPSQYTLSQPLAGRGFATAHPDVDDLSEGVQLPKATLVIIPALSVDTVNLMTAAGYEPTLPGTVTVRFKNGTSRECPVTWDLAGLDFSAEGIVAVPGTVQGINPVTGTITASVRVGEPTPNTTKNIALNTNSTANIFPMALGFVSAGNNNPYQAIKGTTAASTAATDRWSDWERSTHHTNPESWLGVAFETSSTIPAARGADQQFTLVPHLVNTVKVMFVDESGTGGAVTFPADYQIQYYIGPIENLTFDTRLSSVDEDWGNGRVRGWTGSPLLSDANWRTVTYKNAKPAVPSANGTMLTVEFDTVNTALIRVLCTPKSGKWTGIQALEVYGMDPPVAYSDFAVTSISDPAFEGDDLATDFLAQFTVEGTKDITVILDDDIDMPEALKATATNNASVSIRQVFRIPSTATVTFTSEDGSKSETYTIRYRHENEDESGHSIFRIGASADLFNVEPETAREGDTVTLSAPRGYELTNIWAVTIAEKEEDSNLLVEVRNNTFTMPNAGVRISATVQPIRYDITYNLDGGVFTADNRTNYNVLTRTFTLNAPSKEGYTFVGWVGTELIGVQETVTIEEGSIGHRVYTAVWRANATENPSGSGSSGSSSSGGKGSASGLPATDVVNTKVDPATGATTVTTTTPTGLVTQVTTAADGQQTAAIHVPQNSAGTVTAAMPVLNVAAAPQVTVNNNSTRPVSVVIPTDGGDTVVAVRIAPDGTETIVPLSVVDEGALRLKAQPGAETFRIMDNKKTFVDVPADHWAAKSVDFTSSRELFLGMNTPETFVPAAAMNRAMMTTVLWRLAEKPGSSVETAFADVQKGSYYEEAVRWGVQTGVVKGTDLGFEPETEITRETLAVMLYRTAGSPAVLDELPRRFNDGDQVSDWARAAMIWAVQNDIINGRDGGLLSPKATASRAEVATMLQRFVNKQV